MSGVRNLKLSLLPWVDSVVAGDAAPVAYHAVTLAAVATAVAAALLMLRL